MAMTKPAHRALRLAAVLALSTAVAAQAAPPKTRPAPPVAPVIQTIAPPPAPNPQIMALPLYPVIAADKRTCTSKTASGLGYTVLRPGSGAMPASGDVALINYIGYLAANGQAFDQSMRAPLEVDRVVAGFAEGMKMANRGAVLRLCIPAALGYGARAVGPIPANSDLVFQIEMIDFRSLADLQREQGAPPPPAPAPTPPPRADRPH